MNALHDLIRQNRVLELGPLPAPRLAPTATIHEALQFLVRGRRGAIVLVQKMRPVGIVTERDIIYRLSGELLTSRRERARMPVSRIMSRPPLVVQQQDGLLDALQVMSEKKCRHLVVIDRAGELKGMLTTADIIQFVADQFPEQTVNLPPRLRQHYDRRGGA